jgi:hypothetical protein
MNPFKRGYTVFAVLVTLIYAAAAIGGWELSNAGTGGARGPQGLSSYRGGK